MPRREYSTQRKAFVLIGGRVDATSLWGQASADDNKRVMMMCCLMRAVRTLGFLVLGIACRAAVADDLPGILMVELAGLKGVQGNVFIAVYDSDATWLGDDALTMRKVVIADSLDGDLVRTELQLPMGEYALSAFYDRDGDGQLTTNFIGMPKEPIGLSNNAIGKFGPASYSDAMFTLGAEPIIQSIIMRDM